MTGLYKAVAISSSSSGTSWRAEVSLSLAGVDLVTDRPVECFKEEYGKLSQDEGRSGCCVAPSCVLASYVQARTDPAVVGWLGLSWRDVAG